jgi:hypothetical protein
MATIVVNVDQTDVIRALREINQNIDRLARRGEQGFNRLGGSIGVTAGIAASLTNTFIEMGRRAVEAILDITAGAIELNKEAELTRKSLIQIFKGNEAAADAFIVQIEELAVKLGVSRTELTSLAKGILPNVGDIQTTVDILSSLIPIGRDAGQQFASIRLAIEEAVSGGNLKSLQRRLNIPPEVLKKAERYAESIGEAAGLAKALKEFAEDTGVNIEATAGSFAVLVGQIGGEITGLQRTLGRETFEELKEQAESVLEIFADKEEDIEDLALAFGGLSAKIAEVVGTNLIDFIEGLDFQKIVATINEFERALDAVNLIFKLLTTSSKEARGELEGTEKTTGKLRDNILVLAKAVALTKATFAELGATLNNLGTIYNVFVRNISPEEALSQFEDLDTAFEDSLKGSLELFEDFEDQSRATEQAIEDRTKATEEGTEAEIKAGEAALRRAKALERLEKLEADATQAQDRINDKREDQAEASQERLNKILLDNSRKRLEDEIKNAQKRVDIATRNAQRIDDIFRRNAKRRTGVAKDLNRDEQDILRNASRDREDLEKDSAQTRINIETDFRQELRKINNEFLQDAQDAERNNDAKAFLEALRAKDQQVSAAKLRRDENIQSAQQESKAQREELDNGIKRQIEDARIGNQRKLEDLQAALSLQLEEQRLNNERQLEAQTLFEERQAEQRQRAFDNELSDLARNNERKAAQLEENLAKELEIVKKFERAKADFAISEAQRVAERTAEIRIRRGTRGEIEGAGAVSSVRDLETGGVVGGGESVTVGTAGPETFIPSTSGTIIPNQGGFSPPISALLGGGNVDNSRSLNIGQVGINPTEAILSQIVRNEMTRMLELL